MFKLEMNETENRYGDTRTELIITDDKGKREYSDGGEPEDNSFARDWDWVPDEIERAYQQGLIDGRAEKGAVNNDNRE